MVFDAFGIPPQGFKHPIFSLEFFHVVFNRECTSSADAERVVWGLEMAIAGLERAVKRYFLAANVAEQFVAHFKSSPEEVKGNFSFDADIEAWVFVRGYVMLATLLILALILLTFSELLGIDLRI